MQMNLEQHHAVRQALKRALAADQHQLLLVANNNGRASYEAWERITSSVEYKRLESNLAETETAIKVIDEIGKELS